MKTYLRVILGVITLGLVVYLLRDIDFIEVWSLFIQADNFYFLLAFLSHGLAILAFNLRSVNSLKTVAKTGFWFNLKCTLGGNFVNIITPGAQIGGEPVRAYYLGKRYKKSKTRIFGAIVADRFFHLITILSFILAAILYILTVISISPELRAILQTALFLIFVFFIMILLINSERTRKWILRLIRKIGWINNPKSKNARVEKIKKLITEHSKEFVDVFVKTVKNKKALFLGILLSVTYWILIYFSSYFLFLSFRININFYIVLAVVSLGTVVGDFSPTPGGIGLVEGSMIFMYSAFGVGFSAAFTVSVLTRMIRYFFHLVLGGISILHLERNFG